MPVYSDPTPDWLKPDNASVMDPSVVKAIRWIAEKTGANDPASQVMGVAGPLEMSFVSRAKAASDAIKPLLMQLAESHGVDPETVRVIAKFDTQSKMGRPSQGEMRYLRDMGLAKEFPDHSFALVDKGRTIFLDMLGKVNQQAAK